MITKAVVSQHFSSLQGYTGVGKKDGKIIVYVDSLDSPCAKSPVPTDMAGKVHFQKNQKVPEPA